MQPLSCLKKLRIDALFILQREYNYTPNKWTMKIYYMINSMNKFGVVDVYVFFYKFSQKLDSFDLGQT